MSTLSLVHPELTVPIGELTPDHIQAAKRKLQSILTTVGISTFIGGIDFSVNESETEVIIPYFQIQFWGLAPRTEVMSAERQLRTLFPGTKATPRPVKIQPWDGNLAALGYALKNTFDRRISIISESQSGRRNSHRNTRDRPLRVEQHIGLLIVLDRIGLHSRLQLSGCRVVKTKGGPQIRWITMAKEVAKRDQ
jgi:hypothetical protein